MFEAKRSNMPTVIQLGRVLEIESRQPDFNNQTLKFYAILPYNTLNLLSKNLKNHIMSHVPFVDINCRSSSLLPFSSLFSHFLSI